MNALSQLIRRIFCKHAWAFHRNIYGDEAMYGARSVERCAKCGAYAYRPHLNPGADE